MVPAARTALDAQERAWREGSEGAALAAQGRLARRRARALRERAERSRGR